MCSQTMLAQPRRSRRTNKIRNRNQAVSVPNPKDSVKYLHSFTELLDVVWLDLACQHDGHWLRPGKHHCTTPVFRHKNGKRPQ